VYSSYEKINLTDVVTILLTLIILIIYYLWLQKERHAILVYATIISITDIMLRSVISHIAYYAGIG